MSDLNDVLNNYISQEALNLKLKIKGQSIDDEVRLYLKAGANNNYSCHSYIEEFYNNQNNIIYEIPICVLSYEFNAKKSTGLLSILRESKLHKLNHKYIIFTNKSKINTYQDFNNIDNIQIHQVPDEINSLVLKRQYVVDYAAKNDIENIFILEDDVGTFSLPIQDFTYHGKIKKNLKFVISNNLAFNIWEYFIKKNNLLFSGLKSIMGFDFCTNDYNFIQEIRDCIQIIHINVKEINKNNIRYDENSGWDDYDFEIQALTKGIKTNNLFMTYFTPPLKSGISTHSNLEIRCKENTTKLLNKWGNLIKIDTRKGLYNAKVNWKEIRKLYVDNK